MVQVKDNFLPEYTYKDLKQKMFSSHVPWFSKSGTVDNKSKDINWFSHCLYNDFRPGSDLFPSTLDLINKLNVSALIEIRANLSLKTDQDYKTIWHTDYPYKNNKTAIFYFNTDTTGTCFKTDNKEKFIEAKENRMVVFDGNIQHCAYLNNKIDRRIVINFNYYEKN